MSHVKVIHRTEDGAEHVELDLYADGEFIVEVENDPEDEEE